MEKLDLWKKIRDNQKLIELEKEGFVRGFKKGKTMDVSIGIVHKSLEKQWKDFVYAYQGFLEEHNDYWKNRVEKAIADLRNVAGCLFFKLQEK